MEPNNHRFDPIAGATGAPAMSLSSTVEIGQAKGALADLKGSESSNTVFASPTDQTTSGSGACKPPPASRH